VSVRPNNESVPTGQRAIGAKLKHTYFKDEIVEGKDQQEKLEMNNKLLNLPSRFKTTFPLIWKRLGFK